MNQVKTRNLYAKEMRESGKYKMRVVGDKRRKVITTRKHVKNDIMREIYA